MTGASGVGLRPRRPAALTRPSTQLDSVIGQALLRAFALPDRPPVPRPAGGTQPAGVDFNLAVVGSDFQHVVQAGHRLWALVGGRAEGASPGDVNLPGGVRVADEACPHFVNVPV